MKRFLSSGFLFFTLLIVATSIRGAQPTRIAVLPVLFIPKDVHVSEQELETYADKLQSELKIAQAKYRTLLETDTFAMFTDRKYNFCYGANDSAFYDNLKIKDAKPDSRRTIEKEVLDWNHDNRIDSRTVYLIFFVRPHNQIPPDNKRFGGGRTFNGPPNSGGGFTVMEMSSLLFNKPYALQTTLVHELGHTFGLPHVDAFGYKLSSTGSMMSYNTKLTAATQGFNPEDYYMLSLNKLAFPNFFFNENKHNPQHKSMKDIERGFLPCMDSSIGPIPHAASKGYELFANGKLASRAEARFYTRSQAQKDCQHAQEITKVKIECRYDGVRFYP